MRSLVAFMFVLAACTPAPRTAPADIVPTTPGVPTTPSVAPAPAPVPETTASAAAPVKPSAAREKPAANAPPKPSAPSTAKAAPPPAVPAAVATAPATRAAPLDIKSLEQRLRETNAIGVMTKLALKNQVDDLLEKFREYHRGQLKSSLAELRRPYELLLMKVLSLLQDGDAALAQAINASREAIWSVLSDRDKFFQFTT